MAQYQSQCDLDLGNCETDLADAQTALAVAEADQLQCDADLSIVPSSNLALPLAVIVSLRAL